METWLTGTLSQRPIIAPQNELIVKIRQSKTQDNERASTSNHFLRIVRSQGVRSTSLLLSLLSRFPKCSLALSLKSAAAAACVRVRSTGRLFLQAIHHSNFKLIPSLVPRCLGSLGHLVSSPLVLSVKGNLEPPCHAMPYAHPT